MSFILDALRKSETARRRSETPDLFATMPGTTAPAPSRVQWPLLAVGGIGVLSLIAALWLFSQGMPARAPVDTAADSSASAPAPETANPTLPATADEPRESAAAAAPETPPARVPEIMPVQPSTASAVASPNPQAATAQTTPAPDVENTARILPAPPEPTVPPPSAPASQSASDRIVSLADLDPEVRKQLPPLKLSMHLWNETPSQRFVIVDGQRLKEGDVLGEIVVERIARDGAVLVWRGNRLKIELR